MSKSIGLIVARARENKGLTREQLAAKLKITPGYLAHVENDHLVRISDALLEGLAKHAGTKLGALNPLILRHNKRTTEWCRAYRAKVARAAKRKAA